MSSGSIEGKAAFITGGSSGIGLACAMECAANGHNIAIFARNEDRLISAALDIRGKFSGVEVYFETADVTDRAALRRAFLSASEAVGQPGILICSAGETHPGYWTDLDESVEEEILQTNYFGVVKSIREALPLMASGGRIVMVSSAAAILGTCGYGAYAPSKFALRGLAEILRVELRQHNLSLTLSMPPDTDTPQLADEVKSRPPVTSRISGLGSVLSADSVARNIYSAVKARRFLALPTISLHLYYYSSPFIAPFLRAYQRRILARGNKDL